MSIIIIERGSQQGKRIPVRKFPFSIGRDPENDLTINDEEVSRFHLRIKQRGRLFIIEDRDSRNGTWVNGDRIINSTLQNNDKILLGVTQLAFHTGLQDFMISGELEDFGMVVKEDLGLNGPIQFQDAKTETDFTPTRLEASSPTNQKLDDAKMLKRIFDFQTNILVTHTLEEAGAILLKSIGRILPPVSRAALFVWSESKNQLFPTASMQFKKPLSFLLSQRSFGDVIFRKQGLFLNAGNPQVTQEGRQRIILPMNHNDKIVCIAHIEIDDPRARVHRQQISYIQALLSRTAPIFETMLLTKELDYWIVGIIETIVATIEAKDTYTHGHSERVSRYCSAIADELKLNRETKKLLIISALCHDIGKIGIPDAILKKASFLSAEEYEEMKLHPLIGVNIIQHVPNAQRFISGIKYHHEKWDGTGYPEGLVGEDIPFFGRIVALADAYDAMVSGRSYSGFMDQTDAVERLSEEKDLFDPEILKAFIKAHENGRISLKTSTQNKKLPE